MGNRPLGFTAMVKFERSPFKVLQAAFQTNPASKIIGQVLGNKPSVSPFVSSTMSYSNTLPLLQMVSQTEPEQSKKVGYQSGLHGRLRSSVQKQKMRVQKQKNRIQNQRKRVQKGEKCVEGGC